jgi:hypothetical protein
MNELKEFKTKTALYRHHVLMVKDYRGTLKEYCHLHNLDPIFFYDCRRRMGLSDKMKRPKSFTKLVVGREPPAPILENKSDEVSDAKWIAELIHHYLSIQ